MKNCLDIQLRERVIPIANENDTVAITELMFTDNDELSVLIAAMMDADRLIMLTNVNGLYDADPTLNHAQLLTKVSSDKDLSNFVSKHKSSLGRGGMLNKSAMAKKAAKLGIQVHIANGKYTNVLTDLLANDIKHTIFESAKKASAKKRWLAHAGHLIKANIIVDNGVAAVINESIARSILPVGIFEITGDFVKGDLVEVLNAEGTKLGIGQTSYDSSIARGRIGKHHQRPLIHHDYFFKY